MMPDKVLMVDPASGWKYGFPCEWDEEKETLEELYVRKEYPEHMWEGAVRFWYEEKESDNEI